MKLQGVSVLFALIVLPLILVLSYYIRLQVKTIDLQNQYDAKLLNSTRDALSAFEINTANEDLSSVSDSLRTIIEASSNVFINTLSTNLGMSNASKSYIEPYVPSLLYTLYDGYYIYAPTRVPTVLTDDDGNAVAVGDVGVTYDGSGYYKYKLVHISQESQDKCTNCTANGTTPETYNPGSEGHIPFDKTSDPSNYLNYDLTSPNFPIEDYGQILYEKKKATPTEETVYTTNIEEAATKTKNVLKSYMPYSARYKRDDLTADFDISVVYTLDNYITIEGNNGDVYYTKSGYLLPNNCYNNSGSIVDLKKYSQEDAKTKIEEGNYYSLELADGTVLESGRTANVLSYKAIENEIISYNNRLDTAHYYQLAINSGAMNYNEDEIVKFILRFKDETGKTITPAADTETQMLAQNQNDRLAQLSFIYAESRKEINLFQYELDKMSAMTYYVTGIIFTEWVQNTFGNVLESDLIEISGQEYRTVNGNELLTYSFDSTTPIFGIVGVTENGITEVPSDSVFTTHKMNVIRNSIQYNLNLAMSTYNNMSLGKSSYAMPVMEQEEWQKILTNPSIVSFLQGYQCGLKTYSNYMIVSSTNNEISVSTEDIFFVDKECFSNEISEYHKIDCNKLSSASGDYIAFTSKETKYDKVYNKHNSLLSYKYDHKNYACYDCINDGNYEVRNIFTSGDDNLIKAYYIGVGKCRNNLYKMNAVEKPQGYEIIYDLENMTQIQKEASLDFEQIKAIEIVTKTIKTTNANEPVLQYKVKYNGVYLTNEIYAISSNVVVDNTIYVRVDPLLVTSIAGAKVNANGLNQLKLEFENQADASTAYIEVGGTTITEPSNVFKNAIKYIRIIYK